MADRVGTVVVGGGQAGLAVSWELTQAGVDHLVRGRRIVARRIAMEEVDLGSRAGR